MSDFQLLSILVSVHIFIDVLARHILKNRIEELECELQELKKRKDGDRQ